MENVSSSNSHKVLVPKLRFPEFSGEWLPCMLGEIAISIEYGMNAPAIKFDGKNKYIRITDIDDSTNQYINDNPVSPNGVLEERYLVKQNDILFARTGASVGKTYIYDIKDGILYYAGFLIRLRVKPDTNSKYIFTNTLTPRYRKWVNLTSMRSGQPGINSQEFSTYRIAVPTLLEQNKLANFITLIDERLDKQRELIKHLKSYKRGLENIVFRLKCSTVFSISDMLIECVERSTINNQYPIISSTKQGLFMQSEYFNKQAASVNTIGYKILKMGQIVFSPQNLWMGIINYNNKFEIGIVSPSYKIYKVNPNFDSLYVGYLLKSNRAIREYVLASEQGASIVRRNLDMQLFDKIKFNVPDISQQRKIARSLNYMDFLIQNYTSELTILEKTKTYFLQQLFI